MSSEYRSDRATIVPSMFIGLGGTGSRIVDRIAGRAVRLPDWESRMRPLTSFVSIDSNELDQHKLKHIPDGNRLNLAAFDKARAIELFRRSNDRQVLDWLAYQPRPGFRPGAGQIRIEARLGFFYHSPEFRQRLNELVRDSLRPGITWRESNPPRYNVHLFCTLAGGTGSGSFVSAAYLVDAVLRDHGLQPRVVANLLLSTLVLDHVGPELHPDLHANTYAALKELEHLTKLDYRQVKDEGRRFEEFAYCRDENSGAVSRVTTRPCFLSFLFDRPAHLALPNVEEAIADAAFLQVFTPIRDNLVGELDNYEKGLEDLTRIPGDLRNWRQGYTKQFGSFGAAALVLPGHDLLEYSVLRFAAQAIRSHITFGIDRSDPADDRARALALLALDYTDPRLLNRLDEERERAIHQTFITSVQKMARQEESLQAPGGFWRQLAETVDGKPADGGSAVRLVERRIAQRRRELLGRVAIQERAFSFQREEVNRYIEHVSRLVEDVRTARRIVDEGVRTLEAMAEEGQDITDLKLDPITERYLVGRLLEHCEGTWLPEAQQQLDDARILDLGNPKVRKRLELELFESLREAAARRSLFRSEQLFLDARNEAQEHFRNVASAARATLDAEIRLRQMQALLRYLKRRTRQYALLAIRMDALVQDLENRAERLRSGADTLAPALALRVEVFETLDEPRQRLWDRVYRTLFLDGGPRSSLFDRRELIETIVRELKTEGTPVEKSVDRTVDDLRRALHALGRELLAPTIFGSADRPGIDLARGLELEAKLALSPLKQPDEDVTEAEIDQYQERKFRSLARMAGIFARIDGPESRQFDDGVKVNRTRQLILGLGETSSAKASEAFLGRLQAALMADRRQVRVDRGGDPHLSIVHDSEFPIPLYYFEAVTREIENSYLQLKAGPRRSYPLHIDFHWEESLPNLNPWQPEIPSSWPLRAFAQGLVSGLLSYRKEAGGWQLARGDESENLGTSLAGALYRISDLWGSFELLLSKAREKMGDLLPEERRQRCVKVLEAMLDEIDERSFAADVPREQLLDRPLLQALLHELQAGME